MNVTRSTTRRHAPPGGHTTISFGDDDSASRPATAPAQPQQSVQPPVAPAPHAKKQDSALLDGIKNSNPCMVGIAVCTEVSDASDELRKFCKSTLKSKGINKIRVYEVADYQQLPAGCEYLLSQMNCQGVVALGVLLHEDPSSSYLATSISQCLNQLAQASKKPVIPGLLLAADAQQAQSKVEKAGKRAAVGLANILLPPKKDEIKLTPDSNRALATSKALSGDASQAASVPSSTLDLLTQLRDSFKSHGARGIAGISRKFRIMDDDNSKDLSLSEFKKAIGEHTLGWTDAQLEEVYSWFDEDNSGGISYDEFLFGLKGPMNDRRAQIVLEAFAIMDADKSGIIEVNDLEGRYNAKMHPEVIAGKKTEAAVLREFLDTFDCGEKDGKVSPAEWCQYYSHVSASIDDDDYFELMIRNAWHISGGTGACANSSCRRVLVNHSDGRQTVEEIKNDLGIGKTDVAAMMQNLIQQGITDVTGIDLFGSLDNTSPPAAGTAPPVSVARKASQGPADSMASTLAGTHIGNETPNRSRRHAPGGASTLTFG